MRVKYSSSNSGGRWWLTNEQWLALERDGWTVGWGGLDFCHQQTSFREGQSRAPNTCAVEQRNGHEWNTCEGHVRYTTLADALADGYSWLGCQAKSAFGEFPSIADAVRSWESATGLEASDEGCNCCGSPHSFSTSDPYEYVSGAGIIALLYPDAPTSLRAAAEELLDRRP